MAKISSELQKLREHLGDCAKLYLATDIDCQRLAVASALHGVAKYLEGCDFPPETLLPLIRPATALAERENNALDQIFAERPRNGRPSLTTAAHMRTAILAVLTNAWLQSHENDGRTQPAKLTEAARKMRGLGLAGVTGATLKAAREVVSREGKDHLVAGFFSHFASFYEKVAARFGHRRAFALMTRYVSEHEVTRALGILETPPVSSVDEG